MSKQNQQNRWQDWVTLAVGLWLFCSPFFMVGGSLSDAAAWNAYLLGGAVTVFAAYALGDSKPWEEWINLALGLWLIAAPFALGYYHSESAIAWNQIGMGGLVALDTLWVLAQGGTPSQA